MLSNEAILYYANHPVEFVQDILKADPDPEQKKILRSLVTNQMTSVRSGHGIGKSAVEAWSVIWFMCTHPYPKIPCTAPTPFLIRNSLQEHLQILVKDSRCFFIVTKAKYFVACL